MLWNELLRIGNVSLLQSKSDTQYCVCTNYDETAKEDQQYCDGKYFCYWEDIEQKVCFLSAALEYFRTKTEENYIPRCRLEELCTYFKDGLVQDDYETAMEYFEEECELTENEKEWLGIESETFENYEEQEEDYIPCATNGDYSPSNPWNAPGMSIRDFI